MSLGSREAREALRAQVGASTFAHSERTAETAEGIARLYGVDSGQAHVAGLLHDWCKGWTGEALLAAASRRGLLVTDADRAVPSLLHAPVGACEVAEAFPDLGEAIIESIASHTCGAPRMSPLAMVVYIADAIEPGRAYEGVQALRDAVGAVPLRQLFAQTYATSLHHLIDRRRRIHPVTIEVWNTVVAGVER